MLLVQVIVLIIPISNAAIASLINNQLLCESREYLGRLRSWRVVENDVFDGIGVSADSSAKCLVERIRLGNATKMPSRAHRIVRSDTLATPTSISNARLPMTAMRPIISIKCPVERLRR